MKTAAAVNANTTDDGVEMIVRGFQTIAVLSKIGGMDDVSAHVWCKFSANLPRWCAIGMPGSICVHPPDSMMCFGTNHA